LTVAVDPAVAVVASVAQRVTELLIPVAKLSADVAS
jgi:hypothetical protein